MPDSTDPYFAPITPRQTIGTADLQPPAAPPTLVVKPADPNWATALKWAVWGASALAAVGTFVLAIQRGEKPDPLVIPPLPQVQSGGGDEYTPTFGWVPPSPEQTAASVARSGAPNFADTPAGKVVQGDDDSFLWRMLRQAAGHGQLDDWYPNVNQESVGCCTGTGGKHTVDVCQGVGIVLQGRREQWKPVAVEPIYGMMRVDVGKGQISGDGGVGAWIAEEVQTYGVTPMQKYATVDLSTFDPLRARKFGASGVPADIKAASKLHPVKTVALVKSVAEVKAAIRQGYPVCVCSNQGFTMERDGDGFCRPQGVWNHCMSIIGVRGGKRPGCYILNSWGNSAHTGPRFPADAPPAGFWADDSVIDRMAKQGDTFSYADMEGFPARKLDWFAAAPQPNPFDRLVTLRPNRRQWAVSDPEYALAP